MKITKRTWGKGKSAWVLLYKDSTGSWRKPQFDTKALAQAEWDNVISPGLKAGTHVASAASVTVEQAAADYIKWIKGAEADLEANTISSYVGIIRRTIVPNIGKVKLSELTTPAVEAFKASLFEDPSHTHDSVGRAILQLRCILKRAIKDAKVGHNAAREVEVKKPKVTVNEEEDEVCLKVIPVDTVKLLLAIAKSDYEIPADATDEVREAVEALRKYPDTYPMLVILANCGLRSSELRGLRWAKGKIGDKDRINGLDLDNATLRVNQSTNQANIPSKCKTNAAYRTIPLSPLVVADLKEWKLRCPQGVTTVKVKRGSSSYIERTFDQNPLGLVFPNNQGRSKEKAIGASNVRDRRWIPLLIAAGQATKTDRIDADKNPIYDLDWGLHDLRHFYASRLIADDVNPKRIIEWLGHADFSFTLKVYAKLFEDTAGDQEIATNVSSVLYT